MRTITRYVDCGAMQCSPYENDRMLVEAKVIMHYLWPTVDINLRVNVINCGLHLRTTSCVTLKSGEFD